MRDERTSSRFNRLNRVLLFTFMFAPMVAMAELPQYQVLDLGAPPGRTLNVAATAINNAGQVTGEAEGNDAPSHAWLATAGQPMVDLDTSGTASAGYAINEAGQVTGWLATPPSDGGAFRAFVATAGQPMVDLGHLGGDDHPDFPSIGYAINDAGQVTGAALFAEGDNYYQHAFVAEAGQPMIDLGSFGATSIGFDINNAGQVTGEVQMVEGEAIFHVFVTTAGQPLIDLGTLGGDYGRGLAINEAGQVTGHSTTAANETHAFVATAGQPMVDLGTLGGNYSFGNSINEAGQVTGTSKNAAGLNHAFVATAGQPMVDLGTLEGGVASHGRDINAAGQVTGWSVAADGHRHAIVAKPGQPMVDLGHLGGYESYGIAINDAGQVAGHLMVHGVGDDNYRSFLATPISLLFSRLLDDVTGVAPGKSLANSVRTASAYYEADDLQATCSALDYFTNQVESFAAGKKPKITATQAAGFIEDGQAIQDAVGCP